MLASIDIANSQVKIGLSEEDTLLKAINVQSAATFNYLQETNVSNVIISAVNNNISVIEELEKREVEVEKFYYGRKTQEAFLFSRIIHLLVNLFEFIKIIVKIVLTLLVNNLFADFSRFELERL